MELYNLTHRQKEIWYMEKMYPNTSISTISGIFRMKGIDNFKILSNAINNFIKVNDAMRIKLYEDKGNVKQYISSFVPMEFEFLDFSNKGNDEFYSWEKEQTVSGMDIMDTLLFRFVMIKFPDDEGGFYIKVHHTIADAWAMTILVNEIAENYFSILNGKYEDKIKPSYTSYIKKEEEYGSTDRCKKDYEYWMKKYENEPEVARLKERTSKNVSANAKRKTFVLNEKLCKKIYEYSKGNRISVFSMYMAALSIYINRVKGKEKINLGTIILNRSNKEEKDTMGMFVTTAPISIDIDNNDNFMNFSKNVTKETMALMRHQSYPFDVLQEEIREKFGIDDVLYDIVLSYQNAKFLDKNSNNEYKTRWSFCGYQTNSLTIHINDRDNDGKLIVDYDYLTDLFYDKEIEFVHKYIEAILWHAIDNPVKPIKNLDMVSEIEKRKILYTFNDTFAEYPREKVVQELIEETAEKFPDKKAIVFEDESITYKELMNKSNIIANKLREKGTKCNDVVGFMGHRSIDALVSLLGIMKSGAAYLPIDPEYPQDRIEYMLSDSHAKILITENQYKDFCKEIEKIFIDNEDFYDGNSELPKIINKPEDLIYIIYTSGSTGLPKGVMLKHKGVNNFITGVCNKINFSYGKNIASVTTISFDIFVLESWLPLAKGLTIVLANEDEQNNSKKFNEMCVKNNVNMVQTTPSRMGLLTENDQYLDFTKNITDFMVGGEAFPTKLLERLKNISKANIYNMYGPTETTVWSSIKDLTNENKINIGKPIANTTMYILDNNLNLCPIGSMGELYIGGDGLAKGYFERDELNKERFIKNPYNDEIIYKTGDLAKWMANGEIIHLGRNDSQVKIRGYRIELEDIEKNLLKVDGIKDAVIKGVNNNYLIAYLVCNSSVSVSQIKVQLSKDLPKYMMPSYFVRMDKLPYTPNGKINMKKLPNLSEVEIMREEFIEASTEAEKKLQKIWGKVLNVDKVSIRDDFFNIGGDSLGAINLANNISDEFNVNLAVKEIYDNPDIERMARYLTNLVEAPEKKSNHSGVVLLKKSDFNENLFLIHAGNGSAAPYARLCSKITREINCFAIPYPEEEIKEYPKVITMDYLASTYVKIIRNIQPHGPYKLFGWCIGCNIIVEIVHQLAEAGERVDEIYLSAALSPLLDNEKRYFIPEVEKHILGQIITSESVMAEINKVKTVEEIWNVVVKNCSELEKDSNSIRHRLEQIMLPLDITRAIPNYHDIDLHSVFKVLNIIRTVTSMDSFYETDFSTNVKCYYFNPTEDIMLGNQQVNKESWAKIFKDINFVDIKGDHFSFYEKSTDEEFIIELNKRMNNKCN